MQATVVNFLPWKVESTKPGVIPDTYSIPAAVGKYPGVLIINNAVSPIYLDADRGTFPTPIPVEELGKAICNDYNGAFLEADTETNPALFWVEGAWSGKDVLEKFPGECERAKASQNRWFMKLIRKGDDDWARHKQHKMITDIQRYAAKHMNLNKEWAIEPEPVTMVKCPACSSLLEDSAIVCKNCKVILKPEEAKKLGLVFSAA
jgi:hypothetical protein